MKHLIKPLATALAATLQLAILAAVPLAWDVRPGQPAPITFDRYHGETLGFAATFRGFGELPFSPGADIRLWYQTNGMGTAWWSAPATIQSNVLSATWSPELDPGADRISLFFGAPSNAYASAVLRLRHSPGFTPGALDLPPQVLDFATLELRNLTALTNGWSFPSPDYSTNNSALVATIEATAPVPGNYQEVSNRAMSAVQSHQSLWPAVAAATNYTDNVVGTLNVDILTMQVAGLQDGFAMLNDRMPTIGPGATNYTDAAIIDKRDKDDLTVYAQSNTTWRVFRNGVDVSTQVQGLPRWGAYYGYNYQDEETGDFIDEEFYGWIVEGCHVEGDYPDQNTNGAPIADGYGEGATELQWLARNEYEYGYDDWITYRAVMGYVLMPTTDRLATTNGVIAAIREQSLGGIWDEVMQVWWTPRMRNGALTYEATTNVNLNAEH